ncbi:DUF2637 domain-containing protein [Cellulomonas sp. APG4]|uniref:DUF2637 domain-containing protein n=1 Tax=Cellulomonas sp. APG4 TaxID=1538656 RepID=UPI001379E2AF|nr:DUF2637 domain-containing protein [Cellulomonas sp. APG4]NCT90378.1 DUF2637 domain-containing protein [Cellulomonas sp. APG4]
MTKNVSTLTAVADGRIRRAAVLVVVVVAAAAAILSYAGLRDLAISADIDPCLAILLPVVIDGMILAGGLVVLHSTLSGISTSYGWFLTLAGVAVSTWGNVAAVADMDVIAKSVHALAPVSLALTVEALMRIVRHRIDVSQALEAAAAEEAARVAEEQERAERAARRAQEAEERAARRATKAGLTDTAAAMRAVLPRGDASLTDGAIAIVQAFPGRLKSAEVAAALGCTREQALRAVSRGRGRLKAMEGAPEPAHASACVLAAA